MSTYIEFNVLYQLNDDFLKNIKIISVFGHKASDVLIVTKNDIVFGFGQNDWGVLGFGHNRQVNEPKRVKELSGEGVVSFVNGLNHVIGLTNNGKIYSWGRNDFSQLGNGMRNNVYNKPKINQHLINEVIVDISCGAHHSLVLTDKLELYAWGFNDFGQIGNKSEELFQLTPFKLNAFNCENITAISCGFHHSLALTDKGNAFSWGLNDCGQLGIEENDGTYNRFRKEKVKKNKPKRIKIKMDKTDVLIEKICGGCNHSMLLSSDGNIYTFGSNGCGQIGHNKYVNRMTPKKIKTSLKYKDIASHFRYDISIALSVNNVFYIWGKKGENIIYFPEESQLKSINDIFLTYNQITHNPIQISCDFETIINSSFDYKEIENKRTENIDNDIIQIKDALNHFSLLFLPNIIAKYRKKIRIKPNFNQNIKVSFHFIDRDYEWPYDVFGRNALFVAEDGKVLAIGNNSNGLLGVNHNNYIEEPTIVNELSNESIVDFANGINHVIARTDENQIYIWGYNDRGQLGKNTLDDCFVPQLVENLKDECIVDICCGAWHSLALTITGSVFAWGDNEFGQAGNKSDKSYQLATFKIQKFDNQKICAISCGTYHSIALTESGSVYSWGHNDCGQLGFEEIIGLNKPKRIKFKNNNNFELKIKKICCGHNYSLLLTSDGDIYGFGSNSCGQLANNCFINHFDPTKILIENKFTEIASHRDFNLSAALSIDGMYYIWGYCGQQIITEPKATQFDSFNNIFLNHCEITYNRTKSYYKYGSDLMLPTEKDGNYKRSFQEFNIIAFGSYGIVSKVKNKDENEIWAIKRIALNTKNKDSVLKELKIMSQLNCEFVVKVKTFWIEENYLLIEGFEKYKDSAINTQSNYRLFNPFNDLLLHIQMELCFKSLKEIIEMMDNELNSNNEKIMIQIHYYISSELFNEILESVNYLHNIKPPIIHRDLKPANILITHGIGGRFVKLCDFGLSKLHEFDGQSHTTGVGSLKYMAPEVLRDEKYNTKADIYSIAVVIEELIKGFKKQIEAKWYLRKAKPEKNCFKKYKNLMALLELMMKDQKFRPNCEIILNQKNLWALSISDIENDTQLEELCSKSFSIEENFHFFFIKKKLPYLIPIKQNSNFKINFQELDFISSGSFGFVSKVKSNSENEICAIKRIPLNVREKDLVLKEFEIMSQLNSDFVVKVKSVWIEDNYLLKEGIEQFRKHFLIDSLSDHRIFDPRCDSLLHIQMELCFNSLKEIMRVINSELYSNNEKIMTEIHYYITSEFLIEILESVDYLHKRNPPIIHRDLKPANILITNGINGRFVKLCDFGLAKLHEFDGQSHSYVGSFKYMAPEIYDKYYSTKVDIYSIAVVIEELIKGFKKQIDAKLEKILIEKFENLMALLKLMKENQELRPDCELILNQKNSWALSIGEIENYTLLEEISHKSFSIEDNFHSFFIKKKLKISNQSKYH